MKLNFIFKSCDHLRYENGLHVSGPHGGANRAIIVEPNINGGEGYTVTTYNLDGNHPVWRNNVQMAPKQMKVLHQSNDKIVLRGFGYDLMGSSFADYGLTIYLNKGYIDKCILHMHDRNVDIEYLKAQDNLLENIEANNIDYEEFVDFTLKWRSNQIPMYLKRAIADNTDELSNIGVRYYEEGDLESAIYYFNQALAVMPNNDAALKNLRLCYTRIKNYQKLSEVTKKLNHLNC